MIALKLPFSIFEIHIQTKTSEKPKRKVNSLLNIVRCLDEFKKPENQGKSNPEIALIAKDLLNLETAPSRDTIRKWFLKEKKLREQVQHHVQGSKHNRYRKPKDVKRLHKQSSLSSPTRFFVTLPSYTPPQI